MTYSTTIGDSQPTAVAPQLCSLPQTVYAQTIFEDKTSGLNLADISAKQEGSTAMIKLTTGGAIHLAVAQGGTDVATWIVYDGTEIVANTVITPA